MCVVDIRETDDYPEIRVSLKANYAPISVPLTVDVTTGDMITPSEIKYAFPMLFDDRMISIFAYNLETILAEKTGNCIIEKYCKYSFERLLRHSYSVRASW